MTDNGFLMGEETIVTNGIINKSYTGFKFNGNCILDSIIMYKDIKSEQDVLNTSVSTLPEWTPDVIFLASMNNTVDASNVTGLKDSPISWSLYRQEVNSDRIIKLADLPIATTSFTDYKIAGQKEFQYLLFAESATQQSNPIVTDVIKTDFYGIYLIDADAVDNGLDNDNVETYKFDLNTTVDKVTDNNNTVFLKNYTKYQVPVMFDTDFLSGSVTGILSYPDVNDEELGRIWDADYIDKFRTFINNKKQKYMKFRDGKVIKVITSSEGEAFEYKFEDEMPSQVPTVTFFYQEVADVES